MVPGTSDPTDVFFPMTSLKIAFEVLSRLQRKVKVNDNRHFVCDMVTVALPESLLAYPNIRSLISIPGNDLRGSQFLQSSGAESNLIKVAMTEMEKLTRQQNQYSASENT